MDPSNEFAFLDTPAVDGEFSFLDQKEEQPQSEPIKTTPLSFEQAVEQEAVSSGISSAESYANSNPAPISIGDQKALKSQGITAQKEYITSGKREADQHEAGVFGAFGQGLKGGALRAARSLNFAGGLEPVTGYFDPRKADDELAGAIKKSDAESNYSLKDPRFWIKNATQLGTQIGVAALTGSPLTAAATFQTAESLNTYDEVMQETNGDRTAAMKAGYWAGGINTLLDTIGLKGMTGGGKKFANRVGNAIGREGSTETTQSLVTALTKDYQILKSQGLSEGEIQKQLQSNAPKYGRDAAIEGFVGSVLGGSANVVLGSTVKQPEQTGIDGLLTRNADAEVVSDVPIFTEEPTVEPFVAEPDAEIDALAGETDNAGRGTKGTGFIDKIIEPISSTLGKIDKRIPQRLRRMEYNQNQEIMRQHGVLDRFESWYSRATPEQKQELHEALLNDDISALPLIAGKDGVDLVTILEGNKAELDTVKRNSNPEEFVPLMASNQAAFNRLLKAFHGQKIDPLRNDSSEAEVLKRAKEELVNNPTSELSKFIEENTLSPITAIRKQIVDDVEGVQFGRFLGHDKNDQRTSIEGIGKELNGQQTAKINSILKSYRTNKKTSGAGSTVKNLTLIDTLGSSLNALSQLGDIGSTAYQSGVWNSVVEAGKALTGKSKLNQQDLGISSGKLDAELGNVQSLGLKRWKQPGKIFSKEAWSSTGKAVETIFDLSGFTTMDKVGKRTMINAAAKKLRSRSKRNGKKLYDELRPLFSSDAEVRGVLKELRGADPKQYGDDTKFVLFSKLLDIQPIENSEVPQAYLDAGNGRLLYTLKTFALRRLDFIRQESLSKIARGSMKEKVAGVKNLAKIVVLMGGSEAAIDQLKELIKSGKPLDEDFSDIVTDNLAQMVFTSGYKQSGNNPVQAHLEGLLPVMKLPVAAVQDINRFRKDSQYEVNSRGVFEDKSDSPSLKSAKSVPLVGELYSNWSGYDKQRRANKPSSLQADYSEAKRSAKLKAERSGSKKDLKAYRYLTKQQSGISKITSKINKLKEMERRSGRKRTADIQRLINSRDKRLEKVMEGYENF